MICQEITTKMTCQEIGQCKEMYKFLKTYKLLKLNQEEIENLTRTVTSNKIESAIKKPTTNKSPGPDSFTG